MSKEERIKFVNHLKRVPIKLNNEQSKENIKDANFRMEPVKEGFSINVNPNQFYEQNNVYYILISNSQSNTYVGKIEKEVSSIYEAKMMYGPQLLGDPIENGTKILTDEEVKQNIEHSKKILKEYSEKVLYKDEYVTKIQNFAYNNLYESGIQPMSVGIKMYKDELINFIINRMEHLQKCNNPINSTIMINQTEAFLSQFRLDPISDFISRILL